jgi:hypothetical protein
VGQEFELVEKPTKTHAERRFTLDAGTIREVGGASPPDGGTGPHMRRHHRRRRVRVLPRT